MSNAGESFSQLVADNVMAAVISEGKSVRRVARETGIPETRLRGRLHNVRPFNTDELDAVASVLGVHPASFVPRV